jgi:hypothetical protein
MGDSGYDVSTAPEIDFKPKAYEHGTYRMNQLYQVTGGQSKTLQANAIETSTFELPTRVFNLSKSILSFRLDQTVYTALGAELLHPNLHAQGLPMIDRIALFTRGGIYVSDIVNFNYFTNIVAPVTTSMDKLVNAGRAIPEVGITAVATVANGVLPLGALAFNDSSEPVTNLLHPFTGQNTTAVAFTQQVEPVAGSGVGGIAARHKVEGSNQAYEPGIIGTEEPTRSHRYTYQGYASPLTALATVAQIISQRYQVKLGEIPDSIYAMNRDLFFGETMLLQIYWSPYSSIGWMTTGATMVESAVANVLTIQDLALYLACETNRGIVETITRSVMANGMRLTVPYVYTNRYTSPGGQAVSVQVRLNRGHGKSLLKVYNAVVKPQVAAYAKSMLYAHKSGIVTTVVPAASVASTVVSPLWDYIYSMLDNERLQEINMNVTNGIDFMYQRENLRGCVVDNRNKFMYNYVWTDNWTGMPLCQYEAADFTECGLDLQQERLYTFFMYINTAALAGTAVPYSSAWEAAFTAPTIFQFFVTQKTLNITLNNISIV